MYDEKNLTEIVAIEIEIKTKNETKKLRPASDFLTILIKFYLTNSSVYAIALIALIQCAIVQKIYLNKIYLNIIILLFTYYRLGLRTNISEQLH